MTYGELLREFLQTLRIHATLIKLWLAGDCDRKREGWGHRYTITEQGSRHLARLEDADAAARITGEVEVVGWHTILQPLPGVDVIAFRRRKRIWKRDPDIAKALIAKGPPAIAERGADL